MANKPINALPALDELQSDDLLAVWDSSLNTAVKMSGQQMVARLTEIADGHGGISSWNYTPPVAPSLQGTLTLTLADGSVIAVPVMNGSKGDTGNQTYVYIVYSSEEPDDDGDISAIPGPWMGIATSTNSTAPVHYTEYTWYEIKGPIGEGVSYTTSSEIEGGTLYTMYTASGTPCGSFIVYNGEGNVDTVNGMAPIAGDVATVVGTVADLTLNGTPLVSGSASIGDAYAALLPRQMLLAPASDFSSTELPLVGGSRVSDGCVEIFKGDNSAGWIEFHGRQASVGDFRMFFNSSTAPTGTWIAVGGDVDFTSLIYFNYSAVGPPLNVLAIKRNGVVYLTVQSCSRVWSGDNSICTIPAGFRPPTQIQFPASASEYNATVYIQAYDGDTKVGYIGAPASTNTRIIFTISYPV